MSYKLTSMCLESEERAKAEAAAVADADAYYDETLAQDEALLLALPAIFQTVVAQPTEDCQRELVELMGFFPVGHAVRLCAERCPLLLDKIAARTPCVDEVQAMRAVRSRVAVTDSILEMSIADAIAEVAQPHHRERQVSAVHMRRAGAAMSHHRLGPRARARRPVSVY